MPWVTATVIIRVRVKNSSGGGGGGSSGSSSVLVVVNHVLIHVSTGCCSLDTNLQSFWDFYTNDDFCQLYCVGCEHSISRKWFRRSQQSIGRFSLFLYYRFPSSFIRPLCRIWRLDFLDIEFTIATNNVCFPQSSFNFVRMQMLGHMFIYLFILFDEIAWQKRTSQKAMCCKK